MRHLDRVTIGAAALAAAGAALTFAATSDHQQGRILFGILVAAVGVSFVGSGLIALTRLPENRVGRMMLAVGFTWFVGALAYSNAPLAFTIGLASGSFFLAVFAHLLLVYPTGRIGSRFGQAVVAIAYPTAILAPTTQLFVHAHPVPGCTRCPKNVFLVRDSHTAFTALDIFWSVVSASIAISIIAFLASRWLRATPAYRRIISPVYVSGAFVVLLLAVTFAVGAFSTGVGNAIGAVAFTSFAVVPLFFVGGLVRSRLAAVEAGRLLSTTADTPTHEQAQEALRNALGDPTLQLAFWREDTQTYVDAAGESFELPPEDRMTVTTKLTYDDAPVAAIVHDSALRHEPERLEGVVAAARLAIQKDRLQAELRARVLELERERDFTRTVVNSAPSFFLLVDDDGCVIRFNNTLANACGRRDDDSVRGRRLWDVFAAPEAARAVQAAFSESLACGCARNDTHLWLGADGKRLIVDWSVQPINDYEGAVRYLITGLDVTARRRQETELRRLYGELEARLVELQREQHFLSAVGKATPSLLCAIDRTGRITEHGVNRAFADKLGYDDEDAVGRLLTELVFPPEARDEALALFVAASEGERNWRDGEWVTKTGERIPVQWLSTPLTGVDEDSLLICGIDISEQRRQAEELRRSRARIVEAGDAERRRLERNLHDGAQQRLVALSIALRLARQKLTADPAAAEQLLARVEEELSSALEELRELARGIHPAILTDRGLRPALESLAARAPVPVELDAASADRLPPQVEAAAFYVVSEALANVAKYAQASNVSVTVNGFNGRAVVEVRDDGVGGADPTRGSGLRGLADRVEALAGTIVVDSRAGEGTSIRAEIPCVS
jgi:PAS domain S-box-containing protein